MALRPQLRLHATSHVLAICCLRGTCKAAASSLLLPCSFPAPSLLLPLCAVGV